MKNKKYLTINLKTKKSVYKIASVVIGSDDSFYVIYANNNFFKKINRPFIIPVKYSYHPDGKKCRFTLGSDKARFCEFAEEVRTPINNIGSSEGLIYISLFEINYIEDLFDVVEEQKSRKYTYKLVINSANYQHLTIRFFLANKTFLLNNPKRNYKEIVSYRYKDLVLIVTTEDTWIVRNLKKDESKIL